MLVGRMKKYLVFIFASVLLTWLMFVFLRPVDLEDADAVNARINNAISTVYNLPELDTIVEDEPNYNVHVFYYPWYGNPVNDGKYLHWNHRYLPHWNDIATGTETKRHVPPDDIGSNFYPKLGTYSSRDLRTIDNHMSQIRKSGIGVLAVSWYPPGMHDDEGEFSDSVLPKLLEEALKFNLKICLHIEPYKGRDEINLMEQLKYISSRYGSHPAFYRRQNKNGQMLPLFYVYDSYLVSSESWQKLLGRSSGNTSRNISVRGTELDGIFIGLLVEKRDIDSLIASGFDGFYTYFGTDRFSYGSTVQNWQHLSTLQLEHNLMFIPSVAPGYVDVRIRSWNSVNSRDRKGGRYYERSFKKAVDAGAKMISITSFNEWHEGTQIEEAVPKTFDGVHYLDYSPQKPNYYLQLTKKLIRHWNNHAS